MTRRNEDKQGGQQRIGRHKVQITRPGYRNPAMPVPDNLAETKAAEIENSSPVCYAASPGLREEFTQPAVWQEPVPQPEKD